MKAISFEHPGDADVLNLVDIPKPVILLLDHMVKLPFQQHHPEGF